VKIGIYNEPAGAVIGGTEFTVAVLAESLRRQHQVEIVHHRPSLTSPLLAKTFALDLEGVPSRYVPYDEADKLNCHDRWSRYRQLKAWHANLSKPYDIFINFTHGLPPFCHAKFGVLVVLFPFFEPFNVWPWIDGSFENPSFLRKRLRRSYYDWEWKKRLGSYRACVAISEFAKKWTKYRWKTDCEVVYPPVVTRFSIVDKSNLILSVGRFTGSGVKKNQLEMAMAFRRMADQGVRDWQFACAGPLSGSIEDIAYFDDVSRCLPGDKSRLLTNVERTKLTNLYEQAKIFWHATGYSDKHNADPELMEHFGIVTVEAMAAGCVPVVINSGGQPEIVEHGVSGFLWNSLDEMVDYTFRLMRDDELRQKMSAAACVRSRYFDRKHFVDRFQNLLKPILS
jgi:L-malate glycosyltransferase